MKKLLVLLVTLSCLPPATLFAGDFDIVARGAGFSYTASPSDWRDINMYQVFTDRVFDGNPGNNLARYSTEGNPWHNQSGSNAENDRHLFQGGDWAGLRQKLDYFQGMGVNCLWISGVQLNEQGFDKRFTPYHAYHPSDFYQVEPMFGTFQELKDLIDDIHARGMYVVLDVVVNHTADLLKYTDCGCNYEGYCESNCGSLWWWNDSIKANPFNDPAHYHNNGNIGDHDWDTYPKYIYGSFLGTEDLKTEDTWVQDQLRNIFKHLIDSTDCDGFRVDAIKHMDYNFIKDWANDMRQHAAYRGKNNFILFGEYFSYDDATQASYCKDNGYSFNSTLWFPMQLTMKNVFAYEQGTDQLGNRMNALAQYGEAADKVVSFMDNHDVDRIALEAGSQWEAKLHAALTFLYTATPVPCLFYGTEHGFNQGDRRNGSPKLGLADFQRECMMDFGYQWGNAYGDKFYASNFYNYIKQLNELRDQYECLRRGAFTQRWQEGGAGLFAYTRTLGDQDALVVFNTSWNNKSANPQVSKPDGTIYENKLNPGETVTVSGGTLNVSLSGKQSKIFIAGQGQALVTTHCNATDLTINYRPNAGPLQNHVGAIRLQITHDGGQDPMDVAMSQAGPDWTHVYALSNAASTVEFTFKDEDTPPAVDDNGGQGWTVDITTCGQPDVDLAEIGPTSNYPLDGEWDVGEDLWVDIQSRPHDAVIDGAVWYSPDGGTTWIDVPLAFNGRNGNSDTWHANLGTYAGGTTIRYAVRLTGRNGDLWDNDGGSDFFVTCNTGPTTVSWIGDTGHWPPNDAIEADNDVWIDIASQAVGAGVTGEVVYSSDGGASWQAENLAHNGTANDKDLWHANIGRFPADSIIRYAVKVVDGDGTEHWDNNGGSNHLAYVNPPQSSIEWFGDAGNAGVKPLPLAMRWDGPQQEPMLGIDEMIPSGIYRVWQSKDLATWSNVLTFTAGADSTELDLYSGLVDECGYFFVETDWVPAGQVYDDEGVFITIQTGPSGGATAAELVYSDDGGATWQGVAMEYAGKKGDRDVWKAFLGDYDIGTVIRYALKVVDDAGTDHWDNNDGNDYSFTVRDPNQTDFQAPTTGYSPQNTTTADPTLDVTLTATDDLDPSPAIYYTTDGSEPTTGSAVYGSPIHVTDQGGGVDMTIKFFAQDNAGNASGVTAIDVKVNETFTFGGDKPYSTNPTLGRYLDGGSITVDGVNGGEWGTNNLIAIDLVNDDPRSLGGNWTMHEGPADLTHLWATWDDTTLYLAWQFADITDVLDGANAGSALGGRVSNSQGILQFISFDTINGQGVVSNMWDKFDTLVGPDTPDYQIGLRSDLFASYIAHDVGGVFSGDDERGTDYFATAERGIVIARAPGQAASHLWGVGDIDTYLSDNNTPLNDYIGHDGSRDSFYEMSIPLTAIGMTRATLESQGLGVFIYVGSASSIDSIPNDGVTLNTGGTTDSNSSWEWEDGDAFTAPFARIGAGK